MSIPALVSELAVQTTDGENYGPPLLEQLFTARGGSTGATMSGATSPDGRAAFNIAAHNLWYQMVELSGLMFSGATGRDGSKNPMLNILGWLPVFIADTEAGATSPGQVAVQRERLLSWVDQIRNLLDPPESRRLSDVQCPNCGLNRYTAGEGDDADDGPAIVCSWRADQDMVAVCRNPDCVDHITGFPSEWAGDTAIVHLGRLSGQDINVEAIRNSRAPTEAPPYDDGSKLTVTPEDPMYRVVVASLDGGVA